MVVHAESLYIALYALSDEQVPGAEVAVQVKAGAVQKRWLKEHIWQNPGEIFQRLENCASDVNTVSDEDFREVCCFKREVFISCGRWHA